HLPHPVPARRARPDDTGQGRATADRQGQGRGQDFRSHVSRARPSPDDRDPGRSALRDPGLPEEAMTPDLAAEIAASLDLRALPPEFYANPYPVYARLR